MSTWLMINVQDASTTNMQQLNFFHDETMFILTIITTLIIYMMIHLMNNKFNNKFLIQNQNLELIWTIFPMFMLMYLALPSLSILYMIEECQNPNLTVKMIGHQWYWTYEYSDYLNLEFDSYMIKIMDSTSNNFRLLDVDNRLVLPMDLNIRLLTTSNDVIHSWAMPSMGIKMDSVPGRLNQAFIMINRPGLFFGQCSEICGSNHSFMPIVIESVDLNSYITWFNQMYSI